MIICGIDSALESTGVSFIKVSEGKKLHLLFYCNIVTSPNESLGKRLDRIYDALVMCMNELNPDYIFREKGFIRNGNTSISLSKVAGVIEFLAHQCAPYQEIPQATVKKLVTGSGKATKEDVRKALDCYFTEPLPVFKTDQTKKYDESDSIAVAIAGAKRKGLIA